MSNLNKIMRHQFKEQSQFRVHFYIKYVYYEPGVRSDQFLENITIRLAKIIPISLIQIATPLKKYVDISVGLQNDTAAFNFIDSGRRLLLPGQTGNNLQHDIFVSEAFRPYCKAMKQGKLEDLSEKQVKENYKSQYSSSSSEVQKRRQRQNIRKRRQEDHRKREQDEIKALWIFCIPFEFKERDVCISLSQKNIRVKSYEWKLKEDMEYLQVQLLESINLKQLEYLDCKIEKYPILILPRLQDQNNVYQHILKHEIQINFQKDIDQIQFIKLIDKIGGVLSLIKDQYYGPRRYIVAMNLSFKVDQLVEQLSKKYKNCQCQRPKNPIRLGRLQKTFTFAQTVENLASYEQQM